MTEPTNDFDARIARWGPRVFWVAATLLILLMSANVALDIIHAEERAAVMRDARYELNRARELREAVSLADKDPA